MEGSHTQLHVIESLGARECRRCCLQSPSHLAQAWELWEVSPERVGQGEVGYPLTCGAGDNGKIRVVGSEGPTLKVT